MIYRIKTNPGDYSLGYRGLFNGEMCHYYMERDRDDELIELVDKLGLRIPKNFKNSKARWFFTKLGWDKIGKKVTSLLRKEEVPFEVIRVKNPKRSRVVYSDPYQLAVLPRGKRL